MGLSRTPYNKINIHVGGHYNNKQKTIETFCRNYDFLPESVKTRLTVENDDHNSLYSVLELYEGVYSRIAIPIVCDYHHHRFCSSGLTEQDALGIAVKTWGNIKPIIHYSESKSLEQNIKCPPQAHSDYVSGPVNTYGHNVDVMVEAKQKEKAVMRLLCNS
jgi:UV DNA damage endonuclease